MKIDCSITENYLKEKARMTKNCSISVCEKCPLSCRNNNKKYNCDDFEFKHTKKAIEMVQKWSDEHQQKTYKEDFFERFPNAEKFEDGYPKSIACNLYGEKKLKCRQRCNECWDMVMEE